MKENNNVFSILVLGGSQGAEIFGKVIPEVIKMIKMKGHDIQIMQQCLSNQKKSLVDFYDKNKIIQLAQRGSNKKVIVKEPRNS